MRSCVKAHSAVATRVGLRGFGMCQNPFRQASSPVKMLAGRADFSSLQLPVQLLVWLPVKVLVQLSVGRRCRLHRPCHLHGGVLPPGGAQSPQPPAAKLCVTAGEAGFLLVCFISFCQQFPFSFHSNTRIDSGSLFLPH